MKSFIIWWVVIAISVSIISGFYHFTIPRILKISPYSPLALNTQTPSINADETIAYAHKVQEVLNGHIAMSDLFIWEYKGSPSPFRGEILPALIMAGLAKLGGGVTQGFILADFIGPVAAFFMLTVFFTALSGKKYFAMVTALMIMFFYNYFRFFPYLPSAIMKIVRAWNNGYTSPFLRSFHPQISFGFFLLSQWLIWLILKKSKLKYLWLYLGISLGLLFYTDFFYWTFTLCFIGVVIIWSKKIPFVKSLIIGLTIGLPYFINIIEFYRLSLSRRFIEDMTFKPQTETIPIMITLVLLLLARWGLKNKILSVFWQLYYLSMVVTLLGGKLTGIAIDDPVGHWLLRIIYPLTLGFLLLLADQRLKLKKSIYLTLAGLLLIYQARVHWQFFHRQAQAYYIEPEKLEAFKWINQNTPKDSVVLTTSLKDNFYLTINTHANVFIPRSVFSLAPEAETLERFLIVYKAAGIPSERIAAMFSLTEENRELKAKGRFNFDDCGGHYLYFRRFVGQDYYNCSVPPEQLELILKNYDEIDGDLLKWQNKYRMDYWLGSEPIDFGRLLWENSVYKIYALR